MTARKVWPSKNDLRRSFGHMLVVLFYSGIDVVNHKFHYYSNREEYIDGQIERLLRGVKRR